MSDYREICSFKAGEALFLQGDRPTVAYFILSGSVEISAITDGAWVRINVVTANSIVGEMALLDPAPRMATATALEPTECRAVSAETLARLVSSAPPLSLHILRSLIQTARLKVGIPPVLWQSPGQVVTSLRKAQGFTDRRNFPPGKRIFEGGADADGLYLIQSGVVEIRHGRTGPVLRTFVSGEVFGERGLFEKAERFADAYAVEATTCEFIPVEQFAAIIKETPPILVGFMRIYVKAY